MVTSPAMATVSCAWRFETVGWSSTTSQPERPPQHHGAGHQRESPTRVEPAHHHQLRRTCGGYRGQGSANRRMFGTGDRYRTPEAHGGALVEASLAQLEVGIGRPVADQQGAVVARGRVEGPHEIGHGGGGIVDPDVQLATRVPSDIDDLHPTAKLVPRQAALGGSRRGESGRRGTPQTLPQCQAGCCPGGWLETLLPLVAGRHLCRPSDVLDRPAWLDRSVASPPLRCAYRPVPCQPAHHHPGALPARPGRCRASHRRQNRRRGRRRPPLQAQRRLRPSQRHRPPARLVREPEPAPPVAHGQPATKRRHPPHRHHPALPPPDAKAFRDRRIAMGDTPTEALRALKRRLSDVVFRALLADAQLAQHAGLAHAA